MSIAFCFIGISAVISNHFVAHAAESLSFSTPPPDITYVGDIDKPVHYNWGYDSPAPGLPKDGFYAFFDQSKTFDGQEYFMQTMVDDRVHVELDGNTVIDRQTNGAYNIDRTVLGKLSGYHSIKTTTYDYWGMATAYSDIVPFGSWLAYYYDNRSLSGKPVNAQTIAPNTKGELVDDSGYGSPMSKVPNDNFSSRYVTYKHLPAGDYVIRARADDGVRVYIDGKKVLDRWTLSGYREDAIKFHVEDINGSDTHLIEVQYFDAGSVAKLSFSVNPYDSQITTDSWMGEIYSNDSLSGPAKIIGGTDALNKVYDLNFNWGYGSPLPDVPVNYFSASYKKNINLVQGSYYDFKVKADDGVQVFVDGNLVIDSWKASDMGLREKLYFIPKGPHTIKVNYNEHSGAAGLDFNMEKEPTFIGDPNQPVHYDWEDNSPGQNIPKDGFYAYFDQSKTFDGQEYFMQAMVDDRVHVELDGKTVIDRQTNGAYNIDRAILGKLSGYHSIKTTAFDYWGNASAYSDIVPFGSWLAYYYDNQDLSGKPKNAEIIAPNSDGSFEQNIGYGGPMAGLPSDGFSARYFTAEHLKAGTYKVLAGADDGIRVYVDGHLVMDHWASSQYNEDQYIDTFKVSDNNGSDVHWIEVQYFDKSGNSRFKVNIEEAAIKLVSSFELPVYSSFNDLAYYTSQTPIFSLGYGDELEVLDTQKYASEILYQGKIGWVQSAYLEDSLTSDWWLVKDSRNLRNGPGTSYDNIGSVETGSQVQVLEHKTISGTYTEWYRIRTQSGQEGWIWGALSTDGNQGYDLIKYEFDKVGTSTNSVDIFTPLNETQGTVTASQINSFINKMTGGKKTLMTNMGDAFIKAANESGLNVVYLVSHAGLETGWGNSGIVKDKYNYYGIGAIDSKPAQGAYTFDSQEGGIVAGAIWISKNYVNRSPDVTSWLPYPQPTLDSMRFDNSGHQYASDDAWAVKVAYNAQLFNDFLVNN